MALFGIQNENDFFSSHYLAEVFAGDIKEQLEGWEAQETALREQANAASRRELSVDEIAPHNALRRLAADAVLLFEALEKTHAKTESLTMQRDWSARLLNIFGFQSIPTRVALDDDIELPLLAELRDRHGKPLLWVLEAFAAEESDTDPLTLFLDEVQLRSISAEPVGKGTKKNDWQHLVAGPVFAQQTPPRWVLLASARQWILIDRAKFAQARLLRFDWLEIFSRRETDTLKATAALLHRESLLVDQGQALLDTLDESAHKHAYGV